MNEKNKILIDVTPQYIAEQSKPKEEKYVFAYKIIITKKRDKRIIFFKQLKIYR